MKIIMSTKDRRIFMKIKKIILLSIFVIAVNFFTGCTSGSTLTGDKLVKKSTNNLKIQSNIDMADININSQIPGKVKEVRVKEGDSVKKGDILLVVDSDTLIAKQSQVNAQIEAAIGQLGAAKAARDAASAKFELLKMVQDLKKLTK
jgi:HlyD family secretion protein